MPVVGLMTMPPMVARDAEHNRRHFAALRELAERHGLRELSMGTTQDYLVAVQEGATIIRLGRSLYFRSSIEPARHNQQGILRPESNLRRSWLSVTHFTARSSTSASPMTPRMRRKRAVSRAGGGNAGQLP